MRKHRYSPWRHVGRLPGIDIVWDRGVTRGRVDGRVVTMNPDQTQAERRSSMAHEIVHLERGPAPEYRSMVEERIVEEIAARRLVGVSELVDAVLWSHGIPNHEMADDLWVDRPMLLARIRAMSPEERAVVEDAVIRQERTP